MRVIILAVLLLTVSKVHSEEMYAWEWINDKDFNSSYTNIQAGFNLPVWAARLTGPSSQSHEVEISGNKYSVIQTCKPHDCANENITVIYSPTMGSFAFYNGESAHFLGAPSTDLQKKLLELHQKSYKNSNVEKHLNKSNFTSVASASEVNYAWWVTYRYEPTSYDFQKIKASDLNPNFESLSVFSCDLPATFTVEECEQIKANGLTLRATGDFNSDGVEEIWHVGVAKTKKGQYYKFLIAVSEKGELLHFLNIEHNKPGFSVFLVRNRSLSWAMCMECGDLADLVWSNGSFKLDWRGDYE